MVAIVMDSFSIFAKTPPPSLPSSQGGMPKNDPGIQLKGPNAQILEAAYNQSLYKCLKSDPSKTVMM